MPPRISNNKRSGQKRTVGAVSTLTRIIFVFFLCRRGDLLYYYCRYRALLRTLIFCVVPTTAPPRQPLSRGNVFWFFFSVVYKASSDPAHKTGGQWKTTVFTACERERATARTGKSERANDREANEG